MAWPRREEDCVHRAKPREPAGILKVVKDTRAEALAIAIDFLAQGFPFVTVVADGRVYTAEEFALTVINGERVTE